MPNDDPYRRYLIAVGITTDLPKTGSNIVDSVGRMTRIFTDGFGYKRVTSLDIDPASDQIRKEIREFCRKRQPGDVVALYYTGHADEVNETHRVWTGDTIDSVVGTLETKVLAELMLYDTPLQYALIVLDTCFAGRGGAEALRASMPSMGDSDGKTIALLTAAYPREQIVAGDFAGLFEHAIHQPSVAGHEPLYLAPLAIVAAIDTDKSRPGWQTVSLSLLGARAELPFFPNRRYDPPLHGLDLLTQLQIEQRESRVDDLREHFLPRARGVDVPTESGWRFVGREVALRDLVSWLKNTDDLSARVVTGGPGSGKSAVLGRLVVLSDPDSRRIVPTEGLAADTIPPEGSIAISIHARGLTTALVFTRICDGLRVRAETPADLLREMQGRKFTVAIDAIDEALDPPGLISGVLRPLVEARPKKGEGLRLLLGTRPHLLDSLGMTGSAIDLDDERYADPVSLYQYVVRGLETGSPQSPFHSAPEDLVAEVARAVAEAAGHSFLVALIVSRTLVSATEVPDPADPGWRDSLPANAAAAMHSDLETRLGADADRARDLLRPLAFAQGAGLPWEDLWAPLSSRLSGHDYTDDDLIWLRRQAGSYVVEAIETGHSVYRLYHAALAEYLRQDCDEGHIHSLFTAFLQDRVPVSRQGPDWSRAHPYTLAHLATHAQRSGMLDRLLLDPGYLINAAPAGLLAALPAARDPDAELAGRAYQRAVHQLREPAEDSRFSYLELAARIFHATELASRIAARAPSRRWSVPWTHWPPEHPHRILDGHLGLINGVICADPGDGNPVAASIGQDAKLRIWDVMTAEPRGTYAVGSAPLVAIRTARLPEPESRTVIVLLSADGILYTWDISAAEVRLTLPVALRWRRLPWLRDAPLTLRCLSTSDGRQFAVTGGQGMSTSVWDLSSGRPVASFPARAAPAAIEFTRLIDRRTVVLASMGGAERRLCDLQTGQELPYERRRIRSAWLRSLYDRFIRGSYLTYYAFRGGPPRVAVRFFRKTAIVWDLTASRPLGSYPRGKDDVRVRFTDGRTGTVQLPLPQRTSFWSSWTGRLRADSQPDQPVEGPDSLIPLGPPAFRPAQPDHEPDESLSLRFQMADRFLRVQFHDYLEKPDRETISLTLAGHAADVTGYDWVRLSDGHVIVITGSRDGTVRRWDISSIRPGPSEASEQPRVALHRIASVPLDDGTPVGLTIADGVDVALWNLRTGELIGDLAGRAVAPCAIGVARPREGPPVAVTLDVDQTMRLWTLPDGRQTASFFDDRIRWPGDVACATLPDGTCVAVTSGHGRRSVVWDIATGRIRNVLAGHRGWSACVTCAEGRGLWPLALTGGHDNRVNVWGLHHGQRHRRFRIVSPWTFLVRPAEGRAFSVRALPLDGDRLLTLVATSDGTVRALEPRGFPLGARRAGTVPGHAVGTATLSTGQTVVVTATDDGVIRIWPPGALTSRDADRAPLCRINIEVPVNDITFIDDDTFVLATPNGLTAIRLDARLLDTRASSREPEHLQETAAHAGSLLRGVTI
jgi:WD40 repeat protein